ncbi:PaaI family thioesterase [Tistrella mobilis]|uniref:PaaI family thioesterase n=1 Tax=Tistrella mobilis TaxID=171437 RepID=UPI00355763BB
MTGRPTIVSPASPPDAVELAAILAEGEPPGAYNGLIGTRLVRWQPDYAEVSIQLGPQHLNRAGVPHGGVIASMLDSACGYAGNYCPDPTRARYCVTLSLTIGFISQTRGRLLTARGRVMGGGRKIFMVTGEVTDETGALIASAQGTFRYRGGSESLEGVPRG